MYLLLQSVLVGLFASHCSGKVPMLHTLETRPERVAETEPNLIFISFVINVHVIALLCSDKVFKQDTLNAKTLNF